MLDSLQEFWFSWGHCNCLWYLWRTLLETGPGHTADPYSRRHVHRDRAAGILPRDNGTPSPRPSAPQNERCQKRGHRASGAAGWGHGRRGQTCKKRQFSDSPRHLTPLLWNWPLHGHRLVMDGVPCWSLWTEQPLRLICGSPLPTISRDTLCGHWLSAGPTSATLYQRRNNVRP